MDAVRSSSKLIFNDYDAVSLIKTACDRLNESKTSRRVRVEENLRETLAFIATFLIAYADRKFTNIKILLQFPIRTAK